MNILVIDIAAQSLDWVLRCQEAGHKVRVWMPTEPTGEKCLIGEGMIEKVAEWKAWMGWADLIVTTFNSVYKDELEQWFKKGYPIFGANRAAGALETDRVLGQQVLEQFGIETIPFKAFHNFDSAISYVKANAPKTYVSKPLGLEGDKGLSYVPNDAADLIWKLGRWKKEKVLKKGFILQEVVKGVEMAVGGWFGPSGWSQWLCENWEEKRMMNDGLGINTGEQGTTLRYVKKSKLFEEALRPITDYLTAIEYIGYVDMNCIIVEGKPMPLEFTMRFGWPLFQIQQALHLDDPADWMLDLIMGKDSLSVRKEVAVGVVYSHADYPFNTMKRCEVSDFPLYGVEPGVSEAVHWVEAKHGVAPCIIGGKVVDLDMVVTAGAYVLVVTGIGETIEDARSECYDTIWNIKIPSNRGFRTDIGKRLEEELKELQRYGFAKGLRYE